ncbi:substrate-binding domain-containing protein [Mediterraneibacter glycyrrhizinilyticus]|uniref:substrate-binding domain-containing protein n=1 Tax=Mediterraneibacter glycyrrhizinilyticus TaxID=342942 RepID=UPI001960568C|nr:substrate-binding domain-containing protein [Mediterraneibacter glycyrrhizinilyticus]MBM6752179.1 substrate-binding domain-containing protein [Mediterraneibacter glycyrrhizinilyticus]
MKKKIAGLILLVVLMAVIGGIYFVTGNAPRIVNVDGYVGGEKIELLEDEEVQSVFEEKYGLNVDYSRAGSLDMMTADLSGRDYLFPSSSIALEYYEDLHGSPVQSEIVLNTPIVLYTHQIVLDAFESQGLITTDGDIHYIDMAGLLELIQNGAQWSDIGLPELYGRVSVDTTDPSKSNSGNMFAALVANVLNEGQTVTEADLAAVLPELQDIFGKLGYMETSSSDLFSQFLRMGVGAEPIIAGYESQLIEYAALYPDEYDRIRDDVVMLYPAPTVWSAHVMIALDENGQILLNAMQDEDIQEIAWKKHGFRTGNYGDIADSGAIPAEGVAASITQVAQVPSYDVMKVIIEQLE